MSLWALGTAALIVSLCAAIAAIHEVLRGSPSTARRGGTHLPPRDHALGPKGVAGAPPARGSRTFAQYHRQLRRNLRRERRDLDRYLRGNHLR